MDAYVNPASIRFPRKCPHCSRKAEGSYAIAAMRNLDVFFADYTVPLLIDVPVCGDAFHRRRVAGVVALVAVLVCVIGGGFLAAWFAIDGAWVRAALLGAAVAGLAVGGRTGWDAALLDRWILGASARSVSSTRVKMHFRRDEYFSLWAALNPSASATSGAMGWQPPPKSDAASDTMPVDSRTLPAIVFVVLAATIGIHHWNASNGGEVFFVGLSLMVAFAFVAAGGIVYPPVFWSIGIYGKHLPARIRIIGAVLAVAGLAAGFLLAISYGRR